MSAAPQRLGSSTARGMLAESRAAANAVNRAAANAVSSMTAAPSRARELLFLCESAAHQLETAGLEISIGG